MTGRRVKRGKACLTAGLLMAFLYFSGGLSAAAETAAKSEAGGKGPLVIYYSRTGTTRYVAEELSRGLAAKCAEIRSDKNRENITGAFTCVLDQLLDRDDEQKRLTVDLSSYNPIIITSPIWIHKLSSPVRTFLKQADLAGKDICFVLTYHGNQTDADDQEMKAKIRSYGINLKGVYKLKTKNTDEVHIRQAAAQLAVSFDRRLVKR